MQTFRSSGIVLIVAALGFLSACGGGDDGDGEDFTVQADAICTDEAQQVNELFAEEGNPTSAGELVAVLEKRIPISEDSLAEMRDLDAPDDVRQDYDEFLASSEARIELLRQQQTVASQGDDARVQEIDAQIVDSDKQDLALATEIGFEACAGRLPEDQQEEVRAVLNEVTATGDPAHCTEDYTDILIEQIGGLEECRRAESDQAAQPDSVEIGEIAGVSETTADADVIFTGGPNDGKTVSHFLVYEDGRWKLDAAFEGPPSD